MSSSRSPTADKATKGQGEPLMNCRFAPLAASVPMFGRRLNMPFTPLPGDLFTVRMHWGAETASERFVVSPGREAEGILHMPTGQSGHPWSPFYSNSHDAWAKGAGTPLLPGNAAHRLTLVP